MDPSANQMWSGSALLGDDHGTFVDGGALAFFEAAHKQFLLGRQSASYGQAF
jgi:hypothetical protein